MTIHMNSKEYSENNKSLLFISSQFEFHLWLSPLQQIFPGSLHATKSFYSGPFYLVIFLGALKIEYTINWTDSVQKAFRTIPYGPGKGTIWTILISICKLVHLYNTLYHCNKILRGKRKSENSLSLALPGNHTAEILLINLINIYFNLYSDILVCNTRHTNLGHYSLETIFRQGCVWVFNLCFRNLEGKKTEHFYKGHIGRGWCNRWHILGNQIKAIGKYPLLPGEGLITWTQLEPM